MTTIVTRAGKGAALTHGEMDANFNNLNDDKIEATAMPTGTKVAFFQAAAPVGWTQDVTNTDAMLRVVSGAGGGTGGTDSPTTGLTITDSHTLTIAQMPVHSHSIRGGTNAVVVLTNGGQVAGIQSFTGTFSSVVQNTGSGDGHTHNITHAPKFIDMIICTRD